MFPLRHLYSTAHAAVPPHRTVSDSDTIRELREEVAHLQQLIQILTTAGGIGPLSPLPSHADGNLTDVFEQRQSLPNPPLLDGYPLLPDVFLAPSSASYFPPFVPSLSQSPPSDNPAPAPVHTLPQSHAFFSVVNSQLFSPGFFENIMSPRRTDMERQIDLVDFWAAANLGRQGRGG